MNDMDYKQLPPEFDRRLLLILVTAPTGVSEAHLRQLRHTTRRILQFVTDPRLLPVLRRLRSHRRNNYRRSAQYLHVGTAVHYPNQATTIGAWLIMLPQLVLEQPFQIASRITPDKFNPNMITVKTARAGAEIRARIISITRLNRGMFGSPLYGITANVLNILMETHLIRERVRRIAA